MFITHNIVRDELRREINAHTGRFVRQQGEGGGEKEDDSEIAEANKGFSDMQCAEYMTRKFTNLSF